MMDYKIIFYILFLFTFFACNSDHKTQKKTLKQNTKKEICICVQGYEGIDSSYINATALSLKQQYKKEILILPLQKIPDMALNTRIPALKDYPPRYRADTLLRVLSRNKPKKCDYILGLTNKDITTTNRDKNNKIQEPTWMHIDWGIFGLGFQPGESCVVSSFRLSFGTTDKNLIKNRVRKTVIHEIGHNFGLPHCPEKNCCMNEAPKVNALLATDLQSEDICQKCFKKIENIIIN